MNSTTDQSLELTRLEILRAYKKHMVRKEDVNVSPFTEDRVIRYRADVQDCDVPDIHQEVRDLLKCSLRDVRAGLPSQVVILAGNPGMGKSHIINYFRSSQVADELGYVPVGNANHWKVTEFEERLLDWVLDPLVRPSPNEPHLLLDKIQDLAFQALSQMLSQPGQVARYKRGQGAAGVFRRVWSSLFGNDHVRFQQMVDRRDDSVFRRLSFSRFAGYVCDRFLHETGNPFHRYVVHILLCYLFPEDREKVLHWLRRKEVHPDFLRKLGALDAIDRSYKFMDVIKILISLFTRDVARNLPGSTTRPTGDRVFFFAFDQMEGRKELFDGEADWFSFFAQLSELYNSLPNVFIVFTMTLQLAQQLYPKMEKQFQDRIQRDQRYWLHDIPDSEILTLFQRRVSNWLGDNLPEIREKIQDPALRFAPFRQDEILGLNKTRTLREVLEQLDVRFRHALSGGEVLAGPRCDYLVKRNELRQEEQNAKEFEYTANHLSVLKELFDRVGDGIAKSTGLYYNDGAEWKETLDKVPALRLEFHENEESGHWLRVFIVRLPFKFSAVVDGCSSLLHGLQIKRNFLWLVRSKQIDTTLETLRSGQTFARQLPAASHTNLRAMLWLAANRAQYLKDGIWEDAENVIAEELKQTYLGELLAHVRQALCGQMPDETCEQASIEEIVVEQPS